VTDTPAVRPDPTSPGGPVDAGPPTAEPIEERLAGKLSTGPAESSARARATALLRRLGSYDRDVYRSVARMSTPLLDEPLRRVSNFANFSKPWFLTGGVLVLVGGRRGRRAALTGLAAIGAASLVVNQPMKLIGERHRPDRDGLDVPEQRRVTMPLSTSFPSGHAASAAAFAVGVGNLLPSLKVPLCTAASVVAFSRVYTGVHYPSDVLVGALLGRLAAILARRLSSA
jgi:membrane-associated phospholipid phosphatase